MENLSPIFSSSDFVTQTHYTEFTISDNFCKKDPVSRKALTFGIPVPLLCFLTQVRCFVIES